MKSIKTSLLLIALTAFAFACGEDENNGMDGGTGTGANTMSATVDGTDWTADIAAQGTLTNGVLAIAGNSVAGQINITLGSYNGSGTYEFGTLTAAANTAIWTAGASASQVFTTGPGIGSGSITVTEGNGVASGTFSFEAVNAGSSSQVSITSGEFDVSL